MIEFILFVAKLAATGLAVFFVLMFAAALADWLSDLLL